MQAAVWDTYVTKKSGGVMHFDIVVPVAMMDKAAIYDYGREYIKKKGQQGQALDSKECTFCHVEEATPEMVRSIEEKGYHIIEMQGCND